MMQISGSALRSLREEQGLTQLYLATAVGVTTETISRWERQDSPTLKEENALKLADVLETPLDEILYVEEEPEPIAEITPEREESSPTRGKGTGLVVLSLCILLGIFYYFSRTTQPIDISASRLVPGHSPSGHEFPVLIRVEHEADRTISLILKERLPAGCKVARSMPKATSVDDTFVKWVARDVPGSQLFAYLASCTTAEEGGRFKGTLLVRKSRNSESDVSGPSRILLSNYHWADTNQDGVIDDEELLAVYDEFDLVKGLQLDVEEVESIWMGSGYRWDADQARFEILP